MRHLSVVGMEETAMASRFRWIAAAALTAAAFFGTAASAQTLRTAMHSDLKVVDPIWTTALISVHHGYMIYDTLFALDETLAVRPQMVERYNVSADQRLW